MQENININNATESNVTDTNTTEQTMEQILSRIDAIVRDSQYIRESYDTLKVTVENADGGDVSAIADVVETAVRHREETNRKALALLSRMYDDLALKDTAFTAETREYHALLRSLKAFDYNEQTMIEMLDRL